MKYTDYKYRIPEGKEIRVITNTDAKNEADDQFAIVHALLSPRFDNRGMIAAHFGSEKSATSMQDSYDEIITVMNYMNFDTSIVRHGAPHALTSPTIPVESEGARLIIEEAMKDDDRPLYVTFLGPLTDMASALLMEPKIADRLTCVWIGGGTYPAGGMEYNLSNDIIAANVVFESNVPVWQVPRNVYQEIIVSLAELELRVYPCGELGKYLFEQLEEHGHTPEALRTTRTGEYWCLGDSPAVGLLLFPHPHTFDWVPAPHITDEMFYVQNGTNRPIRVYNHLESRFILEDFYAKLQLFTQKQQQK